MSAKLTSGPTENPFLLPAFFFFFLLSMGLSFLFLPMFLHFVLKNEKSREYVLAILVSSEGFNLSDLKLYLSHGVQSLRYRSCFIIFTLFGFLVVALVST